MKKTLIEEIKAAEKTAHNSVERAKSSKDSALLRAQKQGRQDLETARESLAGFRESLAKETGEKISQMKALEQKKNLAELKKLENMDSQKINRGAEIVFKRLVSESLNE